MKQAKTYCTEPNRFNVSAVKAAYQGKDTFTWGKTTYTLRLEAVPRSFIRRAEGVNLYELYVQTQYTTRVIRIIEHAE